MEEDKPVCYIPVVSNPNQAFKFMQPTRVSLTIHGVQGPQEDDVVYVDGLYTGIKVEASDNMLAIMLPLADVFTPTGTYDEQLGNMADLLVEVEQHAAKYAEISGNVTYSFGRNNDGIAVAHIHVPTWHAPDECLVRLGKFQNEWWFDKCETLPYAAIVSFLPLPEKEDSRQEIQFPYTTSCCGVILQSIDECCKCEASDY